MLPSETTPVEMEFSKLFEGPQVIAAWRMDHIIIRSPYFLAPRRLDIPHDCR